MKIEKLAAAIAKALDGEIVDGWDVEVAAYRPGDTDVTVFVEKEDATEVEFRISIEQEG